MTSICLAAVPRDYEYFGVSDAKEACIALPLSIKDWSLISKVRKRTLQISILPEVPIYCELQNKCQADPTTPSNGLETQSNPRQGYLRMSQQRDLPESMAWRVIGRLESGQTQRSVADAVGVTRSGVERLWNRFQETGNVRRRPGAGRPRATTSTDDRYIQLTARRNRTENATQLQIQLLLSTGRRVSNQTVRNRLHEGGLYARRPMVCIPLTPRHRAARRRWAAEHRDWEQHDWSQVLFTDESRFSLECGTRRVFVWRDRGTRNNPAFVRERSQYKRAGWMDNARPHRSRLVENMLEAETIQRMEFPACSPDLNPIEHVWDMLGRRIAARPRPPATVRDLEIALLEEWNSIPQSLIDNLIASMANRCAAILAVRGDHTPY
ncbi:transposable element Tcb2 transposase [Trichonephila clavipes]|nr:transposable element Tcb2 transposase [Trichonephila clavipes]